VNGVDLVTFDVTCVKGMCHDSDTMRWVYYMYAKSGGTAKLFRPVWDEMAFFVWQHRRMLPHIHKLYNTFMNGFSLLGNYHQLDVVI